MTNSLERRSWVSNLIFESSVYSNEILAVGTAVHSVFVPESLVGDTLTVELKLPDGSWAAVDNSDLPKTVLKGSLTSFTPIIYAYAPQAIRFKSPEVETVAAGEAYVLLGT